MIELYTADTGNGHRAAIALEECGLAYKARVHDFSTDLAQDPAFMKLNPRGQVPVMVDPDGADGKPLVLAQSAAILVHCAHRAGKFIPKDPTDHARMLQWVFFAVTDAAPTSGFLYFAEHYLPEKSPANAAAVRERLVAHFSYADGQLAKNRYLAGAEVTVADFALYPTYHARREMIAAAPGLKNLVRWGSEIGQRPAVQRAIAACK